MKDSASRLDQALQSRYRVVREVGEGGMAAVYLADDLRHERRVALKVLKPELAAAVGAERFLAEIKTTANLQHPNILPLYDSGEADGLLFYVMPYVEEESLRALLDREKQLPIRDAVRIVVSMAEAVDYAHRRGVIHRDIKPANVLLQDGKPVIADFGIALAVGAATQARLTETGLSMGTPFYMSPEQAAGDRAPAVTSDIYSLGCVLYEMLVGEPPFIGNTAQSVLAKILTQDSPASTDLRPSIPPNVDAAIRKALEKLPADRFSDARAFAAALQDPGFRHGGPTTPSSIAGRGPWTPLSVGLSATALFFALAFVRLLLEPEAPAVEGRFDITPPVERAWVTTLPGRVAAIGHEGSPIVYVGQGPAGTQLWLRPIDALEATPLPGTDGGENPVFSPDGTSIAFWADQSLKTISLIGGPPRTVIPEGGVGSRYIAWGDDDMLYYAVDVSGQGEYLTYRIPSTGGEPELVTDPIAGALRISVPATLPDGKGVLVTVRRGADAAATTVGVVGPEGGSVRELFPGLGPQYSASGHILYVTPENAMMAVPFDPDRLEVTGAPIPVLEDVAIRLPGMAAHFAVSRSGTMVFRQTTPEAASSAGILFALTNVDLAGRETRLPLEPRILESPSWSPDGGSVAFRGASDQLYAYDVVLASRPRQLTFTGNNRSPIYSPDGSFVVFSSTRQGTQGSDLFIKNLEDESQARSLATLPADQTPTQWLTDSVILFEQASAGRSDLWWLDLSDPEQPRPVEYLTSEADLREPAVSPDGTLAAYVVGGAAVHLRTFPEPGPATVVYESAQEALAAPVWSPDGRTLYFSESVASANSTGPVLDWRYLGARVTRASAPLVSSVDTLFTAANTLRPASGASLHPEGDRFVQARLPSNTDPTDLQLEPDRLIVVFGFFDLLRQGTRD